jgi:cytochrome b6-f complex iron-sulfur subunit
MSNEAGGGAKKSTKDILAAARAQAGKPAAPQPEVAAPAPAEAAPAAETPAAPAAPAPGKPKSTADILAAARAAKAGGAPAAGASAPAAGDKPKSTADILAAARAGKAGGAAAAPAGDKPKSTADILAAARAGSGGAAPAAKEKPAAAAAAAKGAAPVGGPKPSVQEMLAAVRGEKAAPGTAAVAEAPKKVAPPMPPKPAPPVAKAAKKGDNVDRRSVLAVLLSPFVLAWVAFTGTALVGILGTLRLMMPNVLTEAPSRFKVGSPGDFDLGTVSEKFKASNGIWVVHTDKYRGKNLIYALASVCTHLGCTPSWLEGEQKFKCPCHGSGFYITGINFEGPAPRPLERVGIRLAEDGMLEVDKSVKFQEEMGQWNDPASFVEVG